MSGYPLKSVLELRRREEEAAQARLADATHKVAAAATEAAIRERRHREAGQRLENAERDFRASMAGEGATPNGPGAGPAPAGAIHGEGAAAGARFLARRRAEWQRLRADAASFRAGALADARADEQAARVGYLGARQSREAFEKHEARFAAGQRRVVERREQDRLDEAAAVARSFRPRRDP